MNKIEDPLRVVADLRPARLDQLAEDAYGRNRRGDLDAASAESRGRPRSALGLGSVPAGPGRRRKLFTAGLAVLAAGATAAALVFAVPREAPRKRADATPSADATPHASAPTTVHPPRGEPATAREVLLTAAAHVLASRTTGAYWRVQVVSGTIWPGGTRAHPYDISVATGYDQWNPKSPGQKEVDIARPLGTRPATAADAAAWRAAGSPASWRYSYRTGDLTLGAPWGGNLWPAVATTAAQSPTASLDGQRRHHRLHRR